MKVSVLIPTYNSAPYLAECLESVLAQDFSDMEILVSDDRSTDETLEIIQDFAMRDTRIRWWQNSQNLRQLANHNALLREAKGDYIKILHSDDKLISQLSIAKMVEVLDRNPSVSLVSSACTLLDAHSHSRVDDRRNFFSDGIFDGQRVIKSCFEFQVAANYMGEPSLVMFRRLQALRGFSKEHDYVLDLEMWFYLLEQGHFAYLTEFLCGYRQHTAQLSQANSNGRNEIELLKLLEINWPKPWVGGTASQRMMASQVRFLKKNRVKFGSHINRADALLAKIQSRTNLISRAFFWLEHKTHRSFKKEYDRAVRKVFQQCMVSSLL